MKALLLLLTISLLCASCQSKPKFTLDPKTGQIQAELGNTWLKKSGIDYQKMAYQGVTMESLVIDGDETVVPVKAADVYQITDLAKTALKATQHVMKNPNVVPKDPNLIPKDPNIIPVDPNVIPVNPNLE